MPESPKLNYVVDVHYDIETSCEESGCNQEGICRCGRIVAEHVVSVDFTRLVSTIGSFLHKEDPIDLYCLDRTLRGLEAWRPEKYEIEVCRGYYGQEIHSVCLDFDIWTTLIERLEALDVLTKVGKVEQILLGEYGELLPQLVNREWAIESIHLERIHCGAQVHLEAITNNPYINEDLGPFPIGVVTPEEGTGRYRLWDGCHRYKAALERPQGNLQYRFLVGR